MATMRFTKEHEWIRVDGDEGTVGITNHAQEQLGDIVFVELPEVGRQLARGDEACVVESVKAASEVYAPVSGKVSAVNEALAEDPARVNADAQKEGWFFKITLSDASELDALMEKSGYDEYLTELE